MLKGHMSHMHWQKLTFRKVAYSILGIYVLITCYTGFHLLSRKLQNEFKQKIIQERIKTLSEIADDPDWNPWGEEFESEQRPLLQHNAPALWEAQQMEMGAQRAPVAQRSPLERRISNRTESAEHIVEIWGKAAIGLYLWEHIIEGILEERMNGVWSYGEKSLSSISFRFRTGPGVVPSKVPRSTENLLLVLNGRETAKVEVSKMWLELLVTLPHLHNAAVVLLGNEQCNNSWIHPYMAHNGGLVKVVFLVYDSPEIDNIHFYQWPLGVATYRSFPNVKSSDVQIDQRRQYLFNFLGTVYKNSSRETLLRQINNSSYTNLGFIKPRREWMPSETEESREEYVQVLSNSELTFNPVGLNTECYRIYEAMSLGSVPVIEDVLTPGLCQARSGDSHFLTSPLRLLKEFNAPVIYVKNWTQEIDLLLHKEATLSDLERKMRRKTLVEWYSGFKMRMRDRLVNILLSTFFTSSVR
ncbi:transmembrane protein 5 [Biomphalaria pfeifferi]|uniref:Transmembrane protein 5 n=1 Tax=Biomphalaria pfeifferi TaxID=112525 RepID=A0AAD8B917_BIOPF|nr:transmembrane protein 5 [Biomphalaria pfeifferi]